MPDRREDGQSRDRLSDLEDAWHEAVAGLDARYRRVARWLLLTSLFVAFACAGGFLVIRHVLREQEAGRYRAVYSACLERNHTSRGVVGYLADLGVRPSALRRARARFPVEPDCRAYTIALLGKSPPPGAFDLPAAAHRRVPPSPAHGHR